MIPKQIGFRLTEEEAKQLYFDARERQLSPHKRARELVVEGLNLTRIETYLEQLAQEIDQVRQAQSIIQHELEANRWGLVETLAVLMANQEAVSRDHAREWIRDQFETRHGME